jgi:predicted dienelactone hydrolase
MLCEGLAARGFVVAALDHPGDTLLDWMTGTAVDDPTNEVQRVADVQFVIDTLLGDPECLPPLAGVDATQVAVVGHSYGGFTALAVAAVETPDLRIRGVAGLQPFARSLSRKAIARIAVPTLLIVGAQDQTCPPDTDADRVTGTIVRDDACRIDLAAAGHQACSDVGLYLELEARVAAVPEIVAAFLASMADQITGRAGDPWRPTVGLHLRILGAWLDDVFGIDPTGAARELAAVGELPGVAVRG